MYPKVYHKAVNHLIAFGGHGGNTTEGRHLIAQALVALRHAMGRERAMWERRHMLFISGQFPIKVKREVCSSSNGWTKYEVDQLADSVE